MKTPIINIQEAYVLHKKMGHVVNNFSFRAPYKEFILVHKPFDEVTVIHKVTCEDNKFLHVVCEFLVQEEGEESLRDAYEIKNIPCGVDLRGSQQLCEGDNLDSVHLTCFRVALFALGLMCCKNVNYVPYDPNKKLLRQERRLRERKGKEPYLKYKILEIQPMTKRVTSQEKQQKESDIGQGIHTVRGHFKTYSSEQPLFGKVTGTFWWGDCIKGNAEIGMVEKDYFLRLEPKKLEISR